MDRQEAIKRLKENKEAFGLMDRELQELAKEIGRLSFETYERIGVWHKCTQGVDFQPTFAYRLPADYTEQPEVIEVEIKQDTAGDLRCAVYSYTVAPMITRLNNQSVRFAGYKYADGIVRRKSHICKNIKSQQDPIEMEFPVSALFMRSK